MIIFFFNVFFRAVFYANNFTEHVQFKNVKRTSIIFAPESRRTLKPGQDCITCAYYLISSYELPYGGDSQKSSTRQFWSEKIQDQRNGICLKPLRQVV